MTPDFILIAQVDLNELVVRMIESLREDSRPKGLTAAQVIASLDPQVRETLERQARAAADYVVACCAGAEAHRLQ